MVKGDKTTQTEIFVIRGARQALLGRLTIEALELISQVSSLLKKEQWRLNANSNFLSYSKA